MTLAVAIRAWPGRAVAALAGGLALAAAFPPVESGLIAWVALVPVIGVAIHGTPRQAWGWSLLSGAVFWGLSLSWLLALSSTGGPWPLVALGWLLLSGYCALYLGLFGVAVSGAWRALGNGDGGGPDRFLARLAFLGVVPCVWAGLEYLRGVLFTGFPWNSLGVSQYRNLAAIQLAEWGGVYAVSAVVALMNAVIALTLMRVGEVFRPGGPRSRVRIDLILGMGLCVLVWMNGVRTVARLRRHPGATVAVRVAAVQPNIPQLKKWNEEFIESIYETLRLQTELAVQGEPALVVWPETAIPAAIDTDPVAEAFVVSMARLGVPVLAGVMEEEWAGSRARLYNSSILYGADGEPAFVYRKQHLVPFGEYLPFDDVIPMLQRLAPLGFSCSRGEESTVMRLTAPRVSFSPLICFEDIMPALARRAVRRGARLLINQTNDAWFDGTSGARQHLSHSVFRCIENRVPMVRAANSGITAFIGREGLVDALESGGQHEFAGFKIAEVDVVSAPDALTPYTRYGDLLFGLPCGVAAAAFLLVMGMGNLRMRRTRKESMEL